MKEEESMSATRSTPAGKVLDEINGDSFTPKPFSSTKNKKLPDNIVIDLKKQTIKVPAVEPVEPDGIFHQNVSTVLLLSKIYSVKTNKCNNLKTIIKFVTHYKYESRSLFDYRYFGLSIFSAYNLFYSK